MWSGVSDQGAAAVALSGARTDIDNWLMTGSGACHVREFLTWAGERHRCVAFNVPAPERTAGAATDPDQRWLFPGGMPGQPITASPRLAQRLRTLGIPT